MWHGTSIALRTPWRRLHLVCLALGLLATLSSLHAHRPFEVTSIGRLQHGRLEFTVTLSLTMANFLLRDIAMPEAPAITVENFEAHREALLRLATDFYALHDGSASLRPQRILLALNASGEPEFSLIYPLPTTGPLRIRIANLRVPGLEGINFVRIYDSNESLLGSGLLGPIAPAQPELNVPISAPTVPAASSP